MKTKSAFAAVYTFTVLGASAALATPTLTTLVNFNGTNGENPYAGLLADSSGNLYGTTQQGGSNNIGTVFEIAAGSNSLTTLVNFNYVNGYWPYAGLIADSSGNLYGTTAIGGTGFGNVLEIAVGSNTVTTVANFNSSTAFFPYAGVIADGSGNLYGTTYHGGSGGPGGNGYGTVFKIAAGSNTITTLATFNNSNGGSPYAGLIADGAGNLYGTTSTGGSGKDGTVFEIAAGTNTLTTLVNFNGSNGSSPQAGLIADASGNLYGTADYGGADYGGTVFEIAAGSHTFTTLVNLSYANGADPFGGLIVDASGNLFGTADAGGPGGDGAVFEIAAGTNTVTTLATFNGTNGANPYAGLVADGSGNLYGTTEAGGSRNDGTVFELTGTGFAVPEPTSLTLAGLGCVALLRRRRRMV